MSTSFRFVHTADLHLDSPLKSLARRDPELAHHVANATREALNRTIDLCLNENVHALLIAGDIYDSHHPSVATVGFFHRQLNRLAESNIRVYLIRGNHDHHAKLYNTLDLPEHVVEFIGNKKMAVLPEFGVAIHGVSFNEKHAEESALRDFKSPDEQYRNIALLHTSLGGSEGHDIYAPCTVAELDAMGFNYWALGHIHKRSVAGTASTIVMPGTPQGRDMGESGAKTVTLATLDEAGACTLEEHIVGSVRLERMDIDLNSEPNLSDSDSAGVLLPLTQIFIHRATALKAQIHNIDRWIVRLECFGSANVLYGLRSDFTYSEEELKVAAESLDNVHIDKIRFTVRDEQADESRVQHTLINQLRSTIIEQLNNPETDDLAMDEFERLVKLLPHKAIRDELQSTPEKRSKTIQELQMNGVNELLSLIQVDQSDGH